MTAGGGAAAEPEEPPIRFTNNRKIDRDAAGGAATAPPAGPAATDDPAPEEVRTVDATLLDERTADLQRLQAEYANYRKRAERDRLAAGDLAVGRALSELLPVVDDLDRARAHGDLTGALKAVADKLDAAFGKLGLVSFGTVGDPFDPSIHEAVLHDESDDVSVPTCTTVMRPGFLHRERLLRPAMVGVSDPTHPVAQTPTADPVDLVDSADPVDPAASDADAPASTLEGEAADPAAEPSDTN